MKSKSLPPPPPPPPQPSTRSLPAPPASRRSRRSVLLALLLLLLLTGAVGGTLWWLNHRNPTGAAGAGGDGGKPRDTTQQSPCSDDDDPKYLEALEFGEPIEVSFDRKPLDGLVKTPLPPVEVYPWQPDGLVAILGEHRMRGNHFAVSPDAKTLAVSSGDVYIRFGPMDTLHEKHILVSPGGVHVLAWSPIDNRLAVSSPRGVVLYDVTDPGNVPPPVVLEKPTPLVASLSWSGDGKYLIGGDRTPGRGIAYVWDLATRKIVQRLKHTGPVMSVAFSPVKGDYRALTAGGPQDGTLYLWDAVKSDKEIASIDFRPAKTDLTTYIGHVAISPDGKQGLSCHPREGVRIWDLARFEKGKEVHTLTPLGQQPLAAFSPDSKSVVSAGGPGLGVWLWNLVNGRKVRQLAGAVRVHKLRFLDEDRIIFSGNISNDANIHIHEVKTGVEVLPPHGHLSHVTSVSLAPEGKVIASGSYDHTVRLWGLSMDGKDATTAKQRHALAAGAVYGVGFHPDGKRVYHHGGSYNHLVLADAENGRNVSPAYSKPVGPILSADITRDGRYALTGGSDGVVRMWRLRDGLHVREFAHDGQPRVAIAPDMRRAVRTGGSRTRLLHLRCQTTLREWDPVGWAPFLPDGRSVFLGGAATPAWKITADKVEEAGSFPVSFAGATATHLCADGKHAAAVIGGRVVVFEMASGKQRWTWSPPAPFYGVHAVALSPDGGHLLTANGDGTVYVVQVP